jgi:elongation factor P
VSAGVVGDAADWMKENNEISLMFYDGQVLKVEAPITVELEVTQCDPGLQGDRSTGGTKPAKLETGVTVQVPLFINEGEVIKVDTRTGEYIERVSS